MAFDRGTHGSRNRDHRDRPGPGFRRGSRRPCSRRRRAHRRQGGQPRPRRGRRPGHAPGRRPHHGVLRRGRRRRRSPHPSRPAGSVRRRGGRRPVSGRPQLVGRRRHRRLLHGRPVRVGHRHRGLRRLRGRRGRGPGLAPASRCRRRAHRRARPAAHRTRVGRGHVRHRPGHRAHRPTPDLRHRGRTRSPRQRRGRRVALPGGRPGHDPRVRAERRCRADRDRHPRAGGAVGSGGRRVRCAPGRRVGHRRGRPPLAPAVAPRHHRDPGCARRADLRTGAGGRDVPGAAHRARVRPLGAAPARGRGRGRAPGGHGHARRAPGQRDRRGRERPRRHRPPPGRRARPSHHVAPTPQPRARRPPVARVLAGRPPAGGPAQPGRTPRPARRRGPASRCPPSTG